MRPRTSLDWAQAHLDARHRVDAAGRLVGGAPPLDGPPPRFHLMRTPLGTIWRFAHDLPEPAIRELARLAALEPGCPLDASTPPAPPDRLEPMRRALALYDRPPASVASGPAFGLPDAGAARDALRGRAEGADVATAPDDERLGAWAADLDRTAATLRAALPVAVSRFEGRVVAWCRVACGDPARSASAAVETLESARGRGHASRCVAAWALAIESAGGLPLYSTEWRDRAARRVAEALGLVVHAEDWRFD